MNDKELFRLITSQGKSTNFSIALYENTTDKPNSKLAKQVLKQLAEFTSFCEEQDLEMTSGIREFPKVGMATYLAVSKKNSSVTLMALIVPHKLIDIGDTHATHDD